MQRTVLTLSARTEATVPVETMANLVGQALDCTFRPGEFREVPAFIVDILAMRVGLFEWRGLHQKEIFRLQSYVDDERFVRDPHGELAGIAKLDISGAIIDLLEVRGAGHWHVPSPEEIEAELDHGDAIAARLRAQHES